MIKQSNHIGWPGEYVGNTRTWSKRKARLIKVACDVFLLSRGLDLGPRRSEQKRKTG